MVGQEELHDSASGLSGGLRLGDDLDVGHDLSGTGGDWLGGALDFDEAHSAVSSD